MVASITMRSIFKSKFEWPLYLLNRKDGMHARLIVNIIFFKDSTGAFF